MKERNHAFDFLCGICILRMITLHVGGMCGYRSDLWCSKMMAWTFFFMSFFFFKAGYFNKTVAGNTWEYCKDRTKRLLVPYLTWGVIGNIVFFGTMMLNVEAFRPFLENKVHLEHLWRTSRFWGNAPLWFLFSFYISYMFMHVITRLSSSGYRLGGINIRVKGLRWIILTFPFISYWLYKEGNPLWLSLNNVFLGISFFFLGRLWHWVMKNVDRRVVAVACCLMLAGFYYVNKYHHGEYDMSVNVYAHHAYGAIISTVLALCGFSGLLLMLPQKRIPFVNFIGEHSMVFFVVHYPILHFYRLIHRVFRHDIVHHWEDFILMMLVVLVVCCWLVPYVEKVPWLSGRYGKGKLKVKS